MPQTRNSTLIIDQRTHLLRSHFKQPPPRIRTLPQRLRSDPRRNRCDRINQQGYRATTGPRNIKAFYPPSHDIWLWKTRKSFVRGKKVLQRACHEWRKVTRTKNERVRGHQGKTHRIRKRMLSQKVYQQVQDRVPQTSKPIHLQIQVPHRSLPPWSR